ncbi:radical SAM protein [Eubacterium aggregans]
MKYKSIGIQITNFCDACCEMCCFSCSNTTNQDMDFRLIKSVIDQISTLKMKHSLGITWGEPFAKYVLLKKVATYAKEKRVKFSITSNGSWGGNKVKGMEQLRFLKESGLNKISLSYYVSN